MRKEGPQLATNAEIPLVHTHLSTSPELLPSGVSYKSYPNTQILGRLFIKNCIGEGGLEETVVEREEGDRWQQVKGDKMKRGKGKSWDKS